MRTTGLLATLVAAVLVAGCGGENPKPATLPSPSASPSTTSSPSPTPPVLPAAAKEKTKAGALALARHYVDLVNYAQTTGDVNALQAVEGPDCQSCIRGRESISKVYRAGGHIQGGTISVQSSQVLPNPGGQWLVILGVNFGPQTIDWPEPRKDQHPAGGRLPMNITVGAIGTELKIIRWSRGA